MEIVVSLIVFAIIFLVIINYMRKLQLDAIHFNLLDLVETVGGQVLRKGFLSRPVYHGAYKGIDLTINFSTERSQKKRRQYLNISMAKISLNNITISTDAWIKGREESSSAIFEPLDIDGDVNYVIRNSQNTEYLKKNHKQNFIDCVKRLTPFTYMYFGQNGLLFERECDNIALCTQHPKLENIVELLYQLTKSLK